MIDISKFDIELNTEILKELEKSFSEGRIDETTYLEAKKKYQRRLKDAQMGIDSSNAPFAVKVSGFQNISSDTLKISGSSTLTGGRIDKFIRISGSARIENTVECNGIHVSGSLKSHGDMVIHGDVKSSGSFSSNGEVIVDGNVKFSASAKIGKNLIAGGSVKCSGSFNCGGFLKTGQDINISGSSNITDYIESSGFLKCSGSLKCGDHVKADEGIHVSGSAYVGGDLKSSSHIILSGMFEIGGNIEGNDISLNIASGLLAKKFFHKKKSSVGGSVSGNRVEVDNTIVNGDISGYDVIIYPRSVINGQIYYVNDIQIDEKAKISIQPIQIPESELKNRINLPNVEGNGQKNHLICPGCGDEIDKNSDSDSNFCPKCGYQY